MQSIRFLLRDESGLELTEYAVAAALIVIPLTLAITDLGDKIAEVLNSLTSEVQTS